jgi:hypothetical protein
MIISHRHLLISSRLSGAARVVFWGDLGRMDVTSGAGAALSRAAAAA